MFVIYRGNKRYNNKIFSSYELARSYVRKQIRVGKLVPSLSKLQANGYWDHSDIFHSNPSISLYDVKIKAL
jgi:hypothetical protein